MLAIMENLKAESRWRALVREFVRELEESLPGKVRLVAALPSPEDRIYESNVLVVLEEDTPETTMEVVRAAARAEDALGAHGEISPLVVGPDDRDAIEAFSEAEEVFSPA
ncbi:MAG: hypothetical protein DRO06_03680 [Thermoproteota archaeon]|nr:MAG: hypothetical protein DRO06_03680 [Candidatus Korarchaeota archaeon]